MTTFEEAQALTMQGRFDALRQSLVNLKNTINKEVWLFFHKSHMSPWHRLANLLPKKLCYFAVIRVCADVSTKELTGREVPGITCAEAVKVWGDRYGI